MINFARKKAPRERANSPPPGMTGCSGGRLWACGQVGGDEPGQAQVMGEGGGAGVVAQGPVDLPEHHVREVDVECVLISDLKRAGLQPLADRVAVAAGSAC